MSITAREQQAIVAAHTGRDPEAFTRIVAVHRNALLAHARRRLRDDEAAHDALQETFLRAYRAIDRFGGEQLLAAWLHRIVDNVCNDELARRRRELVLLERVGLPRVDHVDVRTTIDSSVESTLDSLPETYRETLVLRAVDDLSFREVAVRTGVTQENARARFHRARQLFRALFDGPSALVVLLSAPIIRRFPRLSTLSNPAGGTVPSLQPAAPSQLTSVFASPATMHVVELAAAPERATTMAKVVVAVAASLPVMVAAAPAPSTARAPVIAEPVVAGADTAAVDSASTVESGGATTSSTSTTTIPTSTTVPPPSTVPPVSVTPPRSSNGPRTFPNSADSEPVDDPSADGASDSSGDAVAPAPEPSAPVRITGTLDVEPDGPSTVYRGEVTLSMDEWSVTGWLGCNLDASSRRSGGELRCGFVADDAAWSMSIRAVGTVLGQSDGGEVTSYDGRYSATGTPPDGITANGTAFARFEQTGATVTVVWWLDPAAP